MTSLQLQVLLLYLFVITNAQIPNIPDEFTVEIPKPDDFSSYYYFFFRKVNFDSWGSNFEPTGLASRPPITSRLTLALESQTSTIQAQLDAFKVSHSYPGTVRIWKARKGGFSVTKFEAGCDATGRNKTSCVEQAVGFQNADTLEEIGLYPYSTLTRVIVGSNHEDNLTCTISVRFKGIINLFINGWHHGIGNSVLEDEFGVLTSQVPLTFTPNRFYLVEIYGVSVSIKDISLLECFDSNYNFVSSEDANIITFSPIEVKDTLAPVEWIPENPGCTCSHCVDDICVKCRFFMSFDQVCSGSADIPAQWKETTGFGGWYSPTIVNRYFIRGLNIDENGVYNFRLVSPYNESPGLYYLLVIPYGAISPFKNVFAPANLVYHGEALQLSEDKEVTYQRPEIGNHPFTIYLLHSDSDNVPEKKYFFTYKAFEYKPHPQEQTEDYQTRIGTSITFLEPAWYMIHTFFRPSKNRALLRIEVNTDDPIEAYINGVHYHIEAEQKPLDKLLEFPVEDLYHAIFIVKAQDGAFKVISPSDDPEAQVDGFDKPFDTLLEYSFCPRGFLYNKITGRCVENCPDGLLATNYSCVNPCSFSSPSVYSDLHCKYGFNVEGDALDSPEAGEGNLRLTDFDSKNYTYFALRTVASMTYSKFVPFSYTNYPISKLRKFEFIDYKTAEVKIAAFSMTLSSDYEINVWKTRKGGWSVTTIPSVYGNEVTFFMVINGDIQSHGQFRLYNLDNITFDNQTEYGGIFGNKDDYGSIAASKIVGLDEVNPHDELFCSLAVKHNGIAYVFVDGLFASVGSSIEETSENIQLTEKRFKFSKGDYSFVQIFGIRMDKLDIWLTDCIVDTEEEPVFYEPVLETYSVLEKLEPPIPFVSYSGSDCDGNCDDCSESGECRICADNDSICLDIATGQCIESSPEIQYHTLKWSWFSINYRFCMKTSPNLFLMYNDGSMVSFYPRLDMNYFKPNVLFVSEDSIWINTAEGLWSLSNEGLIKSKNYTTFDGQLTLPSQRYSLLLADFDGTFEENLMQCYSQEFINEPSIDDIITSPGTKIFERLAGSEELNPNTKGKLLERFIATFGNYYFHRCAILAPEGAQITLLVSAQNYLQVALNGQPLSITHEVSGKTQVSITSETGGLQLISLIHSGEGGSFELSKYEGAKGFNGELRTYFEYHYCGADMYDPSSRSCNSNCPFTTFNSNGYCHPKCQIPHPDFGCNYVMILRPNISDVCRTNLTIKSTGSGGGIFILEILS